MQSHKGIVFDIRHFAMGDGPGVRTTVFMKGCSLRCSWCHNPEGRSMYPEVVTVEERNGNGESGSVEKTIGREVGVEDLMKEILTERTVMVESGGGVTFSGGEPLLQHPFLLEMLKRCKEEGLHTAVDTNGYAADEAFKAILPYTDLFLIDFKHSDNARHLDFTSVSTVRITENISFLLGAGARVWIRIPVIPGFNFSRVDMSQIIDALRGMPACIEKVELIPYRMVNEEKYRILGIPNTMKGIASLDPSKLRVFKRMFRRAGFNVEVGG